jgi:hypothetical protein
VIVGLSPSSSLAEALQVSAVDVVTPLLGLTLTESTVGSVLSTVTLVLSESVPLSESVAVAVQVMVSSGELVELVSVSVEPVPRELLSVAFVHA